MLDIQKKLEEGGESYKNEVLESLHAELLQVREKVNGGLAPQEYENYTKYIGSLEASLGILNKITH